MAIVLISGTTHSNKHLIVKGLERNGLTRIKTLTTTPYRNDDRYNHVTEEEYARLFDANAFIESERHAGEGFGLLRKDLLSHLDEDNDAVISLTPSGVTKVGRYLKANDIPHVCVFISVPTITAIERLTNAFKQKEVCDTRFIYKMSSLAQFETKWSNAAYTGNTFDVVFEVSENHDLQGVVSAVQSHLNSLRKSPNSSRKVSFA
jgi:guanylate kinase